MNDKAGLSTAVMGAIQSGRKIEAIKLIREERGIGLKEAKTLIDHKMAAYRANNPEAARAPGSGKLSLMVIIVLLTAVLYYFFDKLT